MSYNLVERKRLLAKSLGISEDEIECVNGNYFETDDADEYRVLDEEERWEALEDEIKETCSYFVPSFLTEQTGLPEVVFNSLVDYNKAVYAIIEKCCDGGFEKFCHAAAEADGYGHFLAPYDNEEIELTDDLFVYRVN